MRKPIAWAFVYSLDGLLADAGTGRTSDLSRVKGDEEGADSGVNPIDKLDSGEGG